METLKTGDKAYIDSFAGLIACIVTRVTGHAGIASTSQRITVRVSRTGRGYRRNERVTCTGLDVVPRACVKRRKYGTRIAAHTVQVDIDPNIPGESEFAPHWS